MDEMFITGKCYICLENCDYKSPCECNQPVHKVCLRAAREYNNMCTICKSPFSDTHSLYTIWEHFDEDGNEIDHELVLELRRERTRQERRDAEVWRERRRQRNQFNRVKTYCSWMFTCIVAPFVYVLYGVIAQMVLSVVGQWFNYTPILVRSKSDTTFWVVISPEFFLPTIVLTSPCFIPYMCLRYRDWSIRRR